MANLELVSCIFPLTLKVHFIRAVVYFLSAPHKNEALEEISMKLFFAFTLMIVAASVPAFAGTKPQTVSLPEAVEVGSTVVPAGDYALNITGTGSSVQATLTQGKKTVASFSARSVPSKADRGVTTDGSGKVPVLVAIQIKDVNLVLEDTKVAGQ